MNEIEVSLPQEKINVINDTCEKSYSIGKRQP